MLKQITHAVAVGLVVLFASVTSLAQSSGADTYKAKCQMCHGAQQQMSGLRLESDDEWTQIVVKGKNKMPAFTGKLTDAQITDVVAYVHTLQK